MQPVLNFARLCTQFARLSIAEYPALIEAVDLALDRVDSDLQVTHLAVVVLGISRTLTRRSVLGRSRHGESNSRASGTNGNQKFTHEVFLTSEDGLFSAYALEVVLNAFVMRRSTCGEDRRIWASWRQAVSDVERVARRPFGP
jgi:hypothetical protein